MDKYIKLDLHIHSIESDDGEYSPQKLMQLCKNAGLEVVAIADHNSVQAITEAKVAATNLGLTLIPAIEIDCMIDGVNLHVLGYNIDEHAPSFTALYTSILKKEQEAAEEKLIRARKLGLHLDVKKIYELSHRGVITGEIIAEVALMDKRNHEFMKDYLPGGKRDDNPYANFYWDYCSKGKQLYIDIAYLTLADAVDMIKLAGGIAILAHPGITTQENIDLLDKIFAYDVMGIEAYSSYHTTIQTKFYCDYARKRNLYITAGSDFHGKTKPMIHLGQMKCVNPDELYHSDIVTIGI